MDRGLVCFSDCIDKLVISSRSVKSWLEGKTAVGDEVSSIWCDDDLVMV